MNENDNLNNQGPEQQPQMDNSFDFSSQVNNEVSQDSIASQGSEVTPQPVALDLNAAVQPAAPSVEQSPVVSQGLEVTPQSVEPVLDVAQPEAPSVEQNPVMPQGLEVTSQPTESVLDVAQPAAPSVEQNPVMPQGPEVASQPAEPVLDVAQPAAPSVEQNPVMPQEPEVQEANSSVNQTPVQSNETASQDNAKPVKSGKSTIIFVIILFGLVALFIFGLPFLIKLGG